MWNFEHLLYLKSMEIVKIVKKGRKKKLLATSQNFSSKLLFLIKAFEITTFLKLINATRSHLLYLLIFK